MDAEDPELSYSAFPGHKSRAGSERELLGHKLAPKWDVVPLGRGLACNCLPAPRSKKLIVAFIPKGHSSFVFDFCFFLYYSAVAPGKQGGHVLE